MRKLSDIPLDNELPPAGKYNVGITNAKRAESKNQKTPFVELAIRMEETEFTDAIFITAPALKRLCLVAQKVCGMSKDTELPDNDFEAANFLAEYIIENAPGKKCEVTIEEKTEIYVPDSGPDMGRQVKKQKRKVAFNGYGAPKPPTSDAPTGDDIPF
jgi:hypothetical protein